MENHYQTIDYKNHSISIYYDMSAENPFESWDGIGNFYHWKDHGREQHKKYCELRGLSDLGNTVMGYTHPDAVLIDKYECSGVSYSIAGEGMNCRFDTSSAWAVWFPDKCLMDELSALKGAKRHKKVLEYARQACTLFNQWANGDVYGYVVKDSTGVQLDSCWGFYGLDDITAHIDLEIKPIIDQRIIDAEKSIAQRIIDARKITPQLLN